MADSKAPARCSWDCRCRKECPNLGFMLASEATAVICYTMVGPAEDCLRVEKVLRALYPDLAIVLCDLYRTDIDERLIRAHLSELRRARKKG